jgi:hypothetical protein
MPGNLVHPFPGGGRIYAGNPQPLAHKLDESSRRISLVPSNPEHHEQARGPAGVMIALGMGPAADRGKAITEIPLVGWTCLQGTGWELRSRSI